MDWRTPFAKTLRVRPSLQAARGNRGLVKEGGNLIFRVKGITWHGLGSFSKPCYNKNVGRAGTPPLTSLSLVPRLGAPTSVGASFLFLNLRSAIIILCLKGLGFWLRFS